MKKALRLLAISTPLLFAVIASNAQNVGIGTAAPAQKLEIAGTQNTIRINGLKAGGTYNPLVSAANSNSNIVYVNNSTGDVYAIPTGSTGTILTISATGVPTWTTPTAASATAWALSGNLNGTFTYTSTPTAPYFGTQAGTGQNATAGGFEFGVGGFGAGRIDNTGQNLALGGSALLDATNVTSTGVQFTVALGYGAMEDATVAARDVAIGCNSLFNASPGSYNVAVGFSALNANTGSNNTAVGYEAFHDQSGASGTNGVAIGYGAASSGYTGANCNFIGYDAGFLGGSRTISGTGDDALGANSMYLIQGGNYNDALGYNSLYNNASGSNNVAIGYYSLYYEASHFSNTAIGAWSLYNTTGSHNTAIGDSTLATNNTGTGNVVLGYQAEALNGTSSSNTVVGYQAAYNDKGAGTNTVMGYQAMYSNTTGGSQNTVIGYQALYNYAPSANGDIVAIGYGALGTITNTEQDVAVGVDALGSTNAGNFNTALGFGAANFVSGSNNTALGYQAFRDQTGNGGSNGIAIGYDAASSGYTGNYDNFIGYESGFTTGSTISGSNDNALGANSLYQVQTGNNNDAVGYNTLYSDITGSSNEAIGYEALYNNNANKNVAVGDSALIANTTGENNTAIGYQANVSANNLSYATAIGSGASAVTNNSLTLGSATAGTLYFPGYEAPGSLLYTAGNNGLVGSTGAGSVGYVLQSNGTNAPTWGTPNTSATAWQLTGNRGTTPATNFVGTSDGAALMFRTGPIASGNAAIAGLIDSTNSNTYLGTGAGNYGGASTYNVAIGAKALNANTTWYNTAVGFEALYKNTSGNQNVALGPEALWANTTGANNIGIGANSLISNVGGANNIAIGFDAEFFATSGNNNTALGYNALQRGNANSNVGIGNWAGYDVTSSKNVAVGDSALAAFGVSGAQNVAVGYQALTSDLTGGQNVAVGYQALASTNGTGNTALGYEASYTNGASQLNTAVGAFDQYTNGAGIQNTSVGAYALFSNTSGSDNVASGDSALYSNTISTGNVALGASSLKTSGGADNTAVGLNALQHNTSAIGNTAVGYDALDANTNGGFNTALGYLAASGATTSSTNNVAVGYNTLNTNTSGTNNTAVGSNANVASGALTNATAIGANAVAGASNTLILGGTGGSQVKVGIGTTTPAQTLEIGLTNGSIRVDAMISGNSFDVASATSNSNIVFANNNTGDLSALQNGTSGQVLTITGGIPTWAPANTSATAWQITGNAGTLPSTNFVGTTDGAALMFRTGLLSSGNPAFGGIIDPVNDNAFFGTDAGDYAGGATNSVAVGYQSGVNNTGADNTFVGSGANVSGGPWTNATAIGYDATVSESNALILGSIGTYVGIGTNVPSQPLYVTQTNDNNKYVISSSATQTDLSNDPQNVAMYGYANGGNNFHGYAIGVLGVANPGSHGGVGLYGAIATSAPILANVNDYYGVYADASGTSYGTGYAAALMGGNVGIGTATPHQTLEIASTTGTIRIDGMISTNSFNATSATSNSNIVFANNSTGDLSALQSGTTGTILTMTGGIPTWAPAPPTSATAWQLTGNAGITNPAAPATYGTSTIAATTAGANWIGTTDGNDIVVGTNGIERMRIGGGAIATAGYVGVGTSTPNSTLQVQGSVSYAVTQLNITNTPSLTYNVTGINYLIEADCSSGSFTLTLPNATTCQGRVYVIVRSDATYNSSYVLNIATFSSGQNIGPYTGSTSSAMALGVNFQQETIMSDGTNWVIITSSFN